jgi:hypothetical protein
MKKTWSNITLGLSLVFICGISIYFILQKIKGENINTYLDFLGNKLLAMVPEKQKKDEVAVLYDRFKQQVEDKKVEPAEVERFAAEILNLGNIADSMRMKKVEETMARTLGIPEAMIAENGQSLDKRTHRGELAHRANEQKWLELEQRLKKIYQFEENLKNNQKEKELIDRGLFKYDSNLHIIVDGRLREELLLVANEDLIKSINELEKQKEWTRQENYHKELQVKLQTMKDSLEELQYAIPSPPALPKVILVIPELDSTSVKIEIPRDTLYKSIPPE